MVYTKRWIKENGEYLEKNEYSLLKDSAKRKGIDIKSYLGMYGITESYSTGEMQDPLTNFAQLTYWVKKIDDEWLFLTKWKYKVYAEESKELKIKITDYLKEKGFVKWKDLFDVPITNWIHKETKKPLTRKSYLKIYTEVRDKNIEDFLHKSGYVKINVRKEKL